MTTDLVLVHSLLTDASAFDVVVPALEEDHRIIRVSLPGFGGTPPLDIDAPTLFDLADVVADAMDAAQVAPDAIVLGNGLGAFVVVALAIEHSDRFGSLIVANGGAVFSDERRVAFTTMSDLVNDGGMEAVVDVAVRRIFTDAYLDDHPEVIGERRSVMVKTDSTAFAAACRALRDMDLRPRLGEVGNPTLVIAGGADATTPPEMSRELFDLLPTAELTVLDGCGHCPPLEQPEAFTDAIKAFVR